MTNDIRMMLDASDATESLRMEGLITGYFRSLKWPAEQGVYYSDPDTGKAREIDVICRHMLNRPKRHDVNGAPLINMYVICECKSLSGWNILLTGNETLSKYDDRMIDHWSGYQDFTRGMVHDICKENDEVQIDKGLLFSYFSGRAHPDGVQLTFPMRLSSPPVDIIATAFRATKSGKDEREKINPVWSAIQSSLSSANAAELRAKRTTTSYFQRHSEEIKEYVFYAAINYDVELARRVFFHPVVFVKSRIFSVDTEIVEINSARLRVKDLDFGARCVDIVRFDYAHVYIKSMITSFEKQAYKSIRNTWNRFEELGWQPGQSTKILAKAFGISRKPSRNKNV